MWSDLLINPSLIDKVDIDDYNMYELISVIIYCFHYFGTLNPKWKSYWDKFEKSLKEQDNLGWPELSFVLSTEKLESVVMRGKFTELEKENNFLMLLMYFIYIEKKKTEYRTLTNPAIRSFLKCVVRKSVSKPYNRTIEYLLLLLKCHMEKYLLVYEDSHSESIVADKILDLIKDV